MVKKENEHIKEKNGLLVGLSMINAQDPKKTNKKENEQIFPGN